MCFGPVDDPAIQSIFAKSGKEWTRAEREQVLSWLYGAARLRRILVHVAYHLGQGTFYQDAEDTWQNFNFHWSDKEMQPIRPLDKVIANYDPTLGKFQSYFCTALAQFSWRAGRRLRQQRGLELPIPDREGEDGNRIEAELPDTRRTGDPVEALERAELWGNVDNCLRQLEKKDPRKASIFRDYYFRNKTTATIAAQHDITEGYCRVLLYRAVQAVFRCLVENCLSLLEIEDPRKASIFREYYFRKKTLATIAAQHDIPENHCESLLFQARQEIARCFLQRG